MFRTFQDYIKKYFGPRFSTTKLDYITDRNYILDVDDSSARDVSPSSPVVQTVRVARSKPPKSPTPKTKHKSKKTKTKSAPVQPHLSPKQKARIRKAASGMGGRSHPSGANGSKKRARRKEFRVSANMGLYDSATESIDTRTDSSSSDDDGPGNPQPGSRSQRSSTPRLRYALEWFRVVQRMVLIEEMDDYELGYYTPSQSILYMVIQGWIDLSEVIAWRHARAELGRALVDNISCRGGFKWLSKSTGVPDTPIPLTEDEEALFRHPWQVCTDPKMRYDWRKDRADRRKHGPFGESVAKYATPAIQEKVLEELLKPEVDIDDVDLPGNWKPLFGPLFRRKRSSSSQPGPSLERETKKRWENDGESRGAQNCQSNEDKENKRKFHSTLEDANDGNDGGVGGWGCSGDRGSGVRNDNEGDDGNNNYLRGGKRFKPEEKNMWEANPQVSEYASNATPAHVPITMDIHEPLPHAEVLSVPGSLEGHPDASDDAMSGVEQIAPPIYQTWTPPQVVANQFNIPENGVVVDQPMEADMEDIGPSITAPGQEIAGNCSDAEMSFEATGPIQISQTPLPVAWPTTNDVDMSVATADLSSTNFNALPDAQQMCTPQRWSQQQVQQQVQQQAQQRAQKQAQQQVQQQPMQQQSQQSQQQFQPNTQTQAPLFHIGVAPPPSQQNWGRGRHNSRGRRGMRGRVRA